MNHGLINKNYYKDDVVSIKMNFPSYSVMKEYFSKTKMRDKYYIAMKAYAAKRLRDRKHNLEDIGECLNTHHSTVIHLIRKYKPIEDFDEFIRLHFTDCIYKELYPKSVMDYGIKGKTYKLIKLK